MLPPYVTFIVGSSEEFGSEFLLETEAVIKRENEIIDVQPMAWYISKYTVSKHKSKKFALDHFRGYIHDTSCTVYKPLQGQEHLENLISSVQEQIAKDDHKLLREEGKDLIKMDNLELKTLNYILEYLNEFLAAMKKNNKNMR